MFERLSLLTENLNLLLGSENREELTRILYNTDRLTAGLADAAPELKNSLTQFQTTMVEFDATLQSLQKLTQTTDDFVQSDAKELTAELTTTLKSASAAADKLVATLEQAEPTARQLREDTLPATQATLQDLRATSRALRSITEKLENEGVGSLLGGRALPEYEE